MKPQDKLNPYAVLGVEPTATHDDIRAAYRRLAKDAHPDIGGDAAVFAKLKLAHDILTNDKRRASYDATGNVSEVDPDNELAAIGSILADAFDNALAGCRNLQQEPETSDLVAAMSFALKGRRQGIVEGLAEAEMAEAKMAKLLGRFETDRADNMLDGIVRFRVGMIQHDIKTMRVHMETTDKAIKFLKQFRFRQGAALTRLAPARRRIVSNMQ